MPASTNTSARVKKTIIRGLFIFVLLVYDVSHSVGQAI
jgi:hypothetical protein